MAHTDSDEYRAVVNHIATGGRSSWPWVDTRAEAEAQIESVLVGEPVLIHSARFTIETRSVISNRYVPRAIALANDE